MTDIDVGKFEQIERLAGFVKEAAASAMEITSKIEETRNALALLERAFKHASDARVRFEADLVAALARFEADLAEANTVAGLSDSKEPAKQSAPKKAPPNPAVRRAPVIDLPDGVMTQDAYAVRLGYPAGKNLGSLKNTGAIPVEAIVPGLGINVALADAGILAAHEKGRCKDRARDAVLAAQAREKGEQVVEEVVEEVVQAQEAPTADDDPPADEPDEQPIDLAELVPHLVVERILLDTGEDAIEILASHGYHVGSEEDDGHFKLEREGEKPLRVKKAALMWKARQLLGINNMAMA